MRALFVTNQKKTEFYSPIARRMVELGVDVFWISTGGRWTRYLLEQGWSKQHILPLHRFGPEWAGHFKPTAEDWERSARVEAAFQVSLKNIVIMDRELNKRPGFSPEAYIQVATREIERFITEKDIAFGFGEDTWAPEILTYAVMRTSGRRYYAPHSIRLPSDRFGFYSSVFQDSLEVVGPATEEHRAAAVETIKGLRERWERPFYFDRKKNPQRFLPHWWEELFLAVTRREENRYDYSVPNLTTRIRRRLAANFNAKMARYFRILEQAPTSTERPYVLVPLQRQPESSIDVYGKSFSDQLEVIRALVRILPLHWELWLKEHPHGIGDRSLGYYDKLLGLPGVRLIHHDADIRALIRNAGLVASVSGTASMEAGILNVPAITLVPVFFAPLLVQSGLNPFAITHHDMAGVLERCETLRADPDRDRLVENFMTDLISRSFEGVVSDPITAPESIAPENSERLALACIQLMRYVIQKTDLFSSSGS